MNTNEEKNKMYYNLLSDEGKQCIVELTKSLALCDLKGEDWEVRKKNLKEWVEFEQQLYKKGYRKGKRNAIVGLAITVGALGYIGYKKGYLKFEKKPNSMD